MSLLLMFLPTIIGLPLNDPCDCNVTLVESSGTYPQDTTQSSTFTSSTNDPLSPFNSQSVHFHGRSYQDATYHVASYFIQCTSLCWIESISITGAAFQGNIWQFWSGNQEALITSLSASSGNSLTTYTIDMTTTPFYNNEFLLIENNSDTNWRYRESIILTSTPLTTEITEIDGIWFDDYKTISDPFVAGWSLTPITVTTNGFHNYYGPYNDIIGPTYGSNFIIHRNFKCKYDSQLDIKFSEIHCETGVSDYITPIYAGTIGSIHYCTTGSNTPDPALLAYNCSNWYGKKVSNYTVENIAGGRIFSVSFDIWVTDIVDFVAVYNVTIACNSYPTQSPTLSPLKAPLTQEPSISPTKFPSFNPTTNNPTTASPTTVSPTTITPTMDPVTNRPTTASPTTVSPTASDPTTASPTTAYPTTATPTTSAPTTVSPTIRTNIPTRTPTAQTYAPSQQPTSSGPTTSNPTQNNGKGESGEIDIDTTDSINELIENNKKLNKLNVTENILFYVIAAIGYCICIVILVLMKHIRSKRYTNKQMDNTMTITNDMSNDISNDKIVNGNGFSSANRTEQPQYLQDLPSVVAGSGLIMDDIVTEIHRDGNNSIITHVTAGGSCLDEPLDTTDENENEEGMDDVDVLEMVNIMTPQGPQGSQGDNHQTYGSVPTSPLSVRSISNESDYNVMLTETETKGNPNIGADEFIIGDEQYNTKGYISE